MTDKNNPLSYKTAPVHDDSNIDTAGIKNAAF